MAKTIGIAVAVIVIAIAAAIAYLATQVDPLVANAIETHGGATTGTGVSVGGVDIALTEGRGRIGDLKIENPKGFDTDYFLHVKDVALSLDLGSLSGSATRPPARRARR